MLCALLAAACLYGCAAPLATSGATPTRQETLASGTLLQTAPDTQPTTDVTEPPQPSVSRPTVPATTESLPLPTTTAPKPPQYDLSSQEELAALAAADTLTGGETVRLLGDWEITAPIVFSVPVTLRLEGSILCSEPILFETYDVGKIEICLAEGAGSDGLDIRFDAPNCAVWWQESEPYGTEALAAAMTNVASYNGVDLREAFGLGGTGTNEILSFAAGKEADGLQWSVEGNVLYLAVSYLVSDKKLEKASVRMTTSDGATLSQTMDLTPGTHRYTLHDANGDQRTYLIITERITYHLPVFYIETEGGREVTSQEEYLSATLHIDTDTAAADLPGLEQTDISIRGRGHYSWNFDKKSYKIRFGGKTSVLGMAASKNWVLLANYTDRSLIQNYVALEMGKVMDNICYHSTLYPVDVFVNGVYRGVYTFGEQLEAKVERIDLVESYTEPDTDYLLEVGGYDDGDVLNVDYFHTECLRHVAIKHPQSDKLTQEQLDYLIGYVEKADEAVRTLTNYEDYIDVDSLIDWVIIHELTYNLDCCFRRSCYLIKEKGGKLKMGPIWDFDLAFGSFYRYEYGDWATVGEKGGYVRVTWMNYLIKDEAFMARFTARWNEVKERLLSTALAAVDDMGALVAPSAEMNFAVWDILGESLPSQPYAHKKYDTYEKMVQRLRAFIESRYNWLDAQLNG